MEGNHWETLADEVLMGLLTRRGTYPEFPNDFGTTLDLDVQHGARSLVQAAIQADIESQVPFRKDRAIRSVGQFAFSFGPGNVVTISFVVTPSVGPTVRVDLPYSGAPK